MKSFIYFLVTFIVFTGLAAIATAQKANALTSNNATSSGELCKANLKLFIDNSISIYMKANTMYVSLSGIADRTEEFYSKSSMSANRNPEIDSMIDAIKEQRNEIPVLQEKVHQDVATFNCNSANTDKSLEIYNQDVTKLAQSIKTYKQSVIDLVVEVKSNL